MSEKGNFDEYVEYGASENVENTGFIGKLNAFSGSVYWTISIVVLLLITAFSLGRYMQSESAKPPVKIISLDSLNNSTSTVAQNMEMSASALPIVNKSTNQKVVAPSASSQPYTDGTVVASKNGTKYHYPWCPGAKQIAPQNLITFKSIEEARKDGLTPASNCKGLP